MLLAMGIANVVIILMSYNFIRIDKHVYLKTGT